jgi:hypothetical protein
VLANIQNNFILNAGTSDSDTHQEAEDEDKDSYGILLFSDSD